MNAKERKDVKLKIEEEIAKSEASIAEYKELTKPIEPENAIGRISRMDAINNKSVTEAALRKVQEKLQKLIYVRDQIDSEGFGICTRCGNAIPIGRLMLMPQSRQCVSCAQ